MNKKNVYLRKIKNMPNPKKHEIENVWYGRNDSRCIFSDIIVDYV